MRFSCFFLCLFAWADALLADPVITEFMASNKHGLTDEDGNHSDWVEIYNPDATSVNLEGWFLTDNAKNLTKWAFPAVTLPAKSYLVVFASGNDRRTVGQPLHTNFSLSADGEYLGLIKPGGVIKTSEFAPFPAQVEDVSYGISSSTQALTLCQQGSAVKAFVPSSNSLGTAWRERVFDDSAWLSGFLAVGYFNYNATSDPNLSSSLGLDIKAQMGGQARSAYIRVPFTIVDPAKVQQMKLRMKYDDGFAAFINGQTAASGNSPTVASLAFNSFALGSHGPTAFEEFDVSGLIPQLVSGTNVLAIQSLNQNSTSSDVYALAEIIANVDTGATPVTGYFPTATPGAQNGGPDSVQLPQSVAFSRPPGTFTAPFSLVLTGAAAGQQIRYVIADPSASPGANIAEPTVTSALYSSAIAINSSKLIRAAVFDANSGQKGKISTAEYLLLETGATNNTSNFTSNLSILVGDDHGAGQPVDSSTGTYTTSMIHIFPPVAGVASLNSTPAVFTRAGLRVRGRSSQGFPKKSYGLETWDEKNEDLKLTLLGLGKESDWILNGPWAYDDTFIHNAFIYELSRQDGYWAPRTQFVEMFTNSNGGKLDYTDYAGVYVLTEKIESGSNRLDLTGIEPGDVSGSALTGGYLFKIDAADPDEVSWHTTRGIPNSESGQSLVIVEPDADQDTSEQIDYLKGYIQAFENALFTDAAGTFATRGYRNYIDTRSWIDYHILTSVSYNTDGLRLSAFFFKDRNEKIHAGPAWDFDRSLGSDDGRDANPRTWADIEYYFTRDWWGQLFKDPDFVQAWVDRWWELRKGLLADSNLNALADALGAQIGNAAGARDAAKWPDNAAIGGVYLNEIAAMKTWLTSTSPGSLGRTNWLDSQLPQPPSASLASGVVSSGTTVTLAGSGPIRYTTNRQDPRASNAAASAGAQIYGAPLSITQTTVLNARRQGSFSPFPSAASINWSGSLLRVYLVNEAFAVASDIAISEINYHPSDPTAAEVAAFPGGISAGDFEFLELRNVGSRTVNTFEMKFADTAPFKELKLDPITLAPGEAAVVVKNRAAFLARYGSALSAKIIGEWGDGSLSNDGEHIRLLARDGTTIQDFTYPDGADGGRSLNSVGAAWQGDAPSPGSNGPSYAQWKDFYFPAGGEGSGNADDPDIDGGNNTAEYSHASNPVVSESQSAYQPTFTSSGNGSDYVFTFTKPVNRPSAQYVVQRSTDLINWTPMADTLVSTAAGIETRAAHVSIADGPAGFFRLQTTVGP